MSADSSNIIPIFGYFRDKRFAQALVHLSAAYESNLNAETAILEALVQIGWEDENMTPAEKVLCDILKERAEIFRHSGERIRKIMRDIAGIETYEDEESSD